MAVPRIPYSVVRRLPKYLMQVQELHRNSQQWVSSQELADALGLTSSTVRQDLSHFDFSGIAKRGYSIVGLEATLAHVLGTDTVTNAIIVGAGNLGRALALHTEFAQKGYCICGIFDNDPKVVGRRVGVLEVRDTKDLPVAVREQNVQIGIIAVPSMSAQQVADWLIISGIRGILNLAYAHLIVPPQVAVVDARTISSLQELSYAIKAKASTRRILSSLSGDIEGGGIATPPPVENTGDVTGATAAPVTTSVI